MGCQGGQNDITRHCGGPQLSKGPAFRLPWPGQQNLCSLPTPGDRQNQIKTEHSFKGESAYPPGGVRTVPPLQPAQLWGRFISWLSALSCLPFLEPQGFSFPGDCRADRGRRMCTAASRWQQEHTGCEGVRPVPGQGRGKSLGFYSGFHPDC